MSEIEIALLTGSFTLLGILSGALIEMQREKWRFSREQKNRNLDLELENKRNFLSPLCYFVDNNILLPYQYSDNFEMLKGKVCGTLDKNIVSIEDLMKNNMHVLPEKLNGYLRYYLNLAKIFSKFYETIGAVYESYSGETRKQAFAKDKEKYLNKIVEFNNITRTLSKGIYTFLNSSQYPSEIDEDLDKKLKEFGFQTL